MKKRNQGRSRAFSDKCGVFGVSGHREASKIAYLGLHALQHRGQESAGIAVSNGRLIKTYKQMGLVGEVFDEAVLENLEGPRAIGHVRYSTAGDSSVRNAQPIGAEYSKGSIAVCHNGTLTNFTELKSLLEKEGSIFGTGSDTECFIHLIARSGRGKVIDRIIEALGQVEGAYSLLFLTEQALIAVRDPYGIRPLALGKLGRSAMVSSESTSFELVSGDPEGARREYRRLASTEGFEGKGYAGLAEIAIRENRFEEALEFLGLALAYDPGDPAVHPLEAELGKALREERIPD